MGARIKTTANFMLALLFVFLAYNSANAACFQAPNNDLIIGSVDEVFPGLIGRYLVSVPNGEIYFVKRDKRVTYKVCDSATEKNAFVKKWSPASHKKQGWVLAKKSDQVIKPADLSRDGLYKVKKVKNTWYLWEWKATKRIASEKWYFLIKSWSGKGVTIKFGDPIDVIRKDGEKFIIKTKNSDKELDFDRAVFTKSKKDIQKLIKIGKIPTTILIIFNIQNSETFNIIAGGPLRMIVHDGKFVPYLGNGNCFYFRGGGKAVDFIKFPTYVSKKEGVVKVKINKPEIGTYYYYIEKKRKFQKLFRPGK